MAVKRRSSKRVTRRRAAKVPRAAKRRRSSRKASKRVTRKARTPRKPKIKYGAMRRVWSGTVDRTKGGLTKKDLCLNKRGKVVSKKQFKAGQKNFKNSALSRWVVATQRARKELGLTGFVACKKGSAFYKLAKKYHN